MYKELHQIIKQLEFKDHFAIICWLANRRSLFVGTWNHRYVKRRKKNEVSKYWLGAGGGGVSLWNTFNDWAQIKRSSLKQIESWMFYYLWFVGGLGLSAKEYARFSEVIAQDGSIAALLSTHNDLAVQVNTLLNFWSRS